MTAQNFLEAFQKRHNLALNRADLLLMALTHRSFAHENRHSEANPDNERLEFLGDAILGFVVGDYLYHQLPQATEGEMTSLRAALVRTETFADFARIWELDRYLRLGWGEAEMGGRQKNKTLCAAFEAVIGAVYLDLGLETVRHLVEPLIAPKLAEVVGHASHREIKGAFQEWAQARWAITPHYQLMKQEGPAHEPLLTVRLWVQDVLWGEGTGSTKRGAEQMAAQMAMERARAYELKQQPSPPPSPADSAPAEGRNRKVRNRPKKQTSSPQRGRR